MAMLGEISGSESYFCQWPVVNVYIGVTGLLFWSYVNQEKYLILVLTDG